MTVKVDWKEIWSVWWRKWWRALEREITDQRKIEEAEGGILVSVKSESAAGVYPVLSSK